MGAEEVEKIKKVFAELKISAKYLEHESVITSEEAAKTRGFELKQGIKALLFTNGQNEWVIVNIPADKKVDTKKIALHQNWSKNKLRMANPEEVMIQTGCEIGAVPPFGHKLNIPLLVDTGVYENNISTFNIGLRTISVKLPTIEMKKIFEKYSGVEGSFTKE